MRWGRRISHLLILVILCILIFYVGIYLQVDVSKNEIGLHITETLMECAGKTFFGRFYYQEKEWSEPETWMITQAFRMIPSVSYIEQTGRENLAEISREDSETYQMILSMQAHDENEVDENGKLIESKENNTVSDKSTSKISVEKLKDFEYLISNFYTVDSSTSVTEKQLNAEKLLKKDMRLDETVEGPKILIYHTHSQEAFKDSQKGRTEDTIMGMGELLAELLNEKYGIETIHHKGVYDLIDGSLDRSKAYQLAEEQIKKELDKNPSVEVVIDLHRDGVRESTHLVTEIDGKQTAQIMFFNGMSRTKINGDIDYLYNPYIEDNLAFSLQMQMKAMEKYPGFTRRIYLKSYRYNMHLMPKTLLVEAGAQTNTVEEMRRAMAVLAEILHDVLCE